MNLITNNEYRILFGVFTVLGVIGLYYSITIIRALVKHRKDKAPLTAYLLNPQKRKVPIIVYAGVSFMLLGVVLLIQILLGALNPNLSSPSNIQNISYLAGYLIGIISVIFVLLEIHFWYNRFKRFV